MFKHEAIYQSLLELIEKSCRKKQAKLPTEQELKNLYSVSVHTIRKAMNRLELNGKIYRVQGRGCFISQTNQPHRDKCLYFFLYNCDTENDYYKTLIKITTEAHLQKGFTFFLRVVPPSSVCTEESFIEEIKRIENTYGVDGILVHSPKLKEKEVSKLASINKPVIFIGDFSSGPFPEVQINQIVGDTSSMCRTAIDHLASKGCHHIIHLSGSQKHYFNREVHEDVAKCCLFHGINLHLLDFPVGVHSLDENQFKSLSVDLINANPQLFKSCDGIFVSHPKADSFYTELYASGVEINKNLCFISNSSQTGIEYIHMDYSPLFKSVFEHFNKLFVDASLKEMIKSRLHFTIMRNS